jgi:hypothetical protein
MTALSRQLENGSHANDLPIGTPPTRDPTGTLSKKVRSELELAKLLANTQRPSDSSNSAASAFSTPGDLLPDEIEQSTHTISDARVEGDAFVALRDLSILVARRKGIPIDHFFPKLMKLLAGEEEVESRSESSDDAPTIALAKSRGRNGRSPSLHPAGEAPSQPVLGPDEVRRRHFSFEPGDDELSSLNRSLSVNHAGGANSLSQRRPNLSSGVRIPLVEAEPEVLLAKKRSAVAEDRMRSRIPSPAQPNSMALGRRMAPSSPSSALVSEDDMHRQNSSSSILTAIRTTPVRKQENEVDIDSLTQPENQGVKGQAKSTPSRKSPLDRPASKTRDAAKRGISS